MSEEKYLAKQVIVFRKDLRNTEGHKIRSGKIGAQCAHASLAAYKTADKIDNAFISWDNGTFAKIVLAVDSEQELLDVYHKAISDGLNVALITDSGFTEFGGALTHTCLCIGPHYHREIDPVTEHLKPY